MKAWYINSDMGDCGFVYAEEVPGGKIVQVMSEADYEAQQAALRDTEEFLSRQDISGEPDTSDVWVNIGKIRTVLAAVRKALGNNEEEKSDEHSK